MSEKIFCDKCNKDITGDVTFKLWLLDVILNKEITVQDLCEKCAKKTIKLLEEKK